MSLESANPNLFDENASPVPEHVGRNAWRIGVVLLWALIALQLAWYLVLLPPARSKLLNAQPTRLLVPASLWASRKVLAHPLAVE